MQFYYFEDQNTHVMSSWRTHPQLAPLFHPSYPDDLPILLHNGGPRTQPNLRPEQIWVRITGQVSAYVFTAVLLNQPHQDIGAKHGDEIQFIVPAEGPLISVTERYLQERADWAVQGCNKCGLTELFDPPSELIAVLFPQLGPGEIPMQFTSFCGACGGIQVVKNRALIEHNTKMEDGNMTQDSPPLAKPKPWWKFWD